jgi:hypothetical protein
MWVGGAPNGSVGLPEPHIFLYLALLRQNCPSENSRIENIVPKNADDTHWDMDPLVDQHPDVAGRDL